MNEKALELARKMIKLSMAENDMVLGLQAAQYTAALLTRLICHYESANVMKAEFASNELALMNSEEAVAEVCRKTDGLVSQQVITMLVSESFNNRKERRKRDARARRSH